MPPITNDQNNGPETKPGFLATLDGHSENTSAMQNGDDASATTKPKFLAFAILAIPMGFSEEPVAYNSTNSGLQTIREVLEYNLKYPL